GHQLVDDGEREASPGRIARSGPGGSATTRHDLGAKDKDRPQHWRGPCEREPPGRGKAAAGLELARLCGLAVVCCCRSVFLRFLPVWSCRRCVTQDHALRES